MKTVLLWMAKAAGLSLLVLVGLAVIYILICHILTANE